MRTHNYQLQVLYDIRHHKSDESESMYAKAQAKVREEQKRLDILKNSLSEAKQKLLVKRTQFAKELQEKSLKIEHAKSYSSHFGAMLFAQKRIENQILTQQDILCQANESLRQAIVKMHSAHVEYKTMQKHKDSWCSQQRKNTARHEEEQQDDISQFYSLSSRGRGLG